MASHPSTLEVAAAKATVVVQEVPVALQELVVAVAMASGARAASNLRKEALLTPRAPSTPHRIELITAKLQQVEA